MGRLLYLLTKPIEREKSMSNKNEATRMQARQILKDGILDMNVERLIQLSQFGFMGNITYSNEIMSVKNGFNSIEYDEEHQTMTFSVQEMMGKYGEISFSIDEITDISGCEDKDDPEEYLNINIKFFDGSSIIIVLLY